MCTAVCYLSAPSLSSLWEIQGNDSFTPFMFLSVLHHVSFPLKSFLSFYFRSAPVPPAPIMHLGPWALSREQSCTVGQVKGHVVCFLFVLLQWSCSLCGSLYAQVCTAGKISFEHVTIFFSKYISKGAIDMNFSQEACLKFAAQH